MQIKIQSQIKIQTYTIANDIICLILLHHGLLSYYLEVRDACFLTFLSSCSGKTYIQLTE